MRILFLSHRIPYPPDKGDKIRSYHLLVHLARRGDVDLVTHVDDPRDLRHRQVLADMCRSVEIVPLQPWAGKVRAARSLLGSAPPSVAYMTRPQGEAAVRRALAARPDVIVGFSSQVAAYLPERTEAPLLMDLVDVDSEKWAQYGASNRGWRGAVQRLEARRLRRWERTLGSRARRIVVTTAREAQLFRDKVGEAPLAVIGNGVVFPDVVAPAPARRPGLMAFVGAMDYEANVEAAEIGARDVLPLVRRRHPEAVFRILGRNPAPRVRALAALPGVEVTGEVADLRPHLEDASLALVPLRVARGMQNKVLEALAHGLPVVATPDVLASLGGGAERAVFCGSDPAGLAAEAVRLLDDARARTEASAAGRAYVREHHDWTAFDRAWDALIDEAITPSAAALCAGNGPASRGVAPWN